MAVLYAGGDFDADLDAISGSSYYGYITKDAVRTRVNGVDGIQFYVWNGSENVLVFADTSNDSDYVAGTIIGYDGISTDADGNNIMSGLDNLTATAVGSISEVGVNNDADTIRLANGGEIDLDNFDTVLYMNSSVKDENGAQSGDPEGTPTEANAQQGVRPTNFIRVNNDVAVLDSNAFVSGPYAVSLGYTLPSDINGVDVQWVDNRTQDNTPNAVYPGALVDLTFKVQDAGTLTINNVKRNDNGATNPTFTFDANDVNDNVVIEGLIVTGTVTFTWNGTGAGGSDAESAKALNEAMKAAAGSTYEYTGKVPTDDIINVPSGKTLVLKNANMNGANISGDVKVEGALTVAGPNAIAGTLTLDSSAAAVTLFPNATLTANSVVDTAASTNAAKVAELLGYTDNLTVKEIASCADITIGASEAVTATKVTFTAMPTSISGTLTAGKIDASAVTTPSAANITTLFSYADDVTVGTVTESSSNVTIGANQKLTASGLNVTGRKVMVDATGTLELTAQVAAAQLELVEGNAAGAKFIHLGSNDTTTNTAVTDTNTAKFYSDDGTLSEDGSSSDGTAATAAVSSGSIVAGTYAWNTTTINAGSADNANNQTALAAWLA